MALRVAFSDFPAMLGSYIRLLRDAVSAGRAVVHTDTTDEADLLVFGDYGNAHRSFVGTKVHYTAENYRPRWDETDFAIGFDHLSDRRYLRLPLFVVFAYKDQIDGVAGDPGPGWDDRSFCNFVYLRPGTRMRRSLFNELNGYRTVTSPGRFLNNASDAALLPRADIDWRRSKIAYQRVFRFTIAAENGRHSGYTTEKLYDALLAGTIPVYWGDPRVSEDLNEGSFINCASYGSLAEVTDLVRTLDQNAELARPYLEARPILRTPLDEWFRRTVEFFEGVKAVAEHGRPEAAHRRAERLVAADTRIPLRVIRLARSAPRSLAGIDQRWLGGVLHRAYGRLPGLRRLARKIRGPGF